MNKVKIGLLFTSQDRYELTRISLESAVKGIDTSKYKVTILWLDGSVEINSKNYFNKAFFPDINLIKIPGFRNFGPAVVTQIGINKLKKIDNFEWLGMFESDCLFLDKWLDECLKAVKQAKIDKRKIGSVTPFSIKGWTIQTNKNYFINDVVGATCCLFTSEAWNKIPPVSIAHPFRKELLKNLAINPLKHPSIELGWDWLFATAIYHEAGLLTISTKHSKLLNCGNSEEVKKIPPYLKYNDEFSKPLRNTYKKIKKNYRLWLKTLKKMLSNSLLSIFKDVNLNLSKYIYYRLSDHWYKREFNNDSWWIWAKGSAEIFINNDYKEDIVSPISLNLTILDKKQSIEVFFNKKSLGILSSMNNKLQLANLTIKKGINIIKFATKVKGKTYLLDNRILAFALYKKIE
ncbi:hypothetical protein HZA76_01235 [Candidatus Roizmanbacteria bacterium]|nr:hypothetical protein [Candidatus Roizmanbacteria bacterium]